MNLAQKILREHLIEGELVQGKEIGIRIDQTLTQDATGTMACLQFEAMNIPKTKTKLSVSYVDHNMLQTGFENSDDHRYLQSVAQKFGIVFSKPGNGICHQVHLERFSIPGETLLGSDSHTPTCGGIGMIAIGAGGLDITVAMGGGEFYLTMPKIVGVKLTGKLGEWVSAKDIILELLRKLTVKGGIGKIFEYYGNGIKQLSVPERATITNMGAELGLTTSIFPSDKNTLDYLKKQKREKDWKELSPDKKAEYDEIIEINLSELEPMMAKPSSPDNAAKVSEMEGMPVEQVLVGSCTNSSFKDLMTVARILEGKKINPKVSFAIAPGSRQVLEMISQNKALSIMINSGARILETSCGPCIGMGQSPATNTISLRTFNRNFPGRSGTTNDNVYLVSPETATISAIEGKITNPQKIGKKPKIKIPKEFPTEQSMFIYPATDNHIEIIRGPNIKPLPIAKELEETIIGEILIKTGDNISTDTIMPAGAKVLPLRSNIPEISKYVFSPIDPAFYQRAIEKKGGFIIGGENYGQGSSREHAALAPMALGIKAVIVKSFARIHKANLINFGIPPLTFKNQADYDSMEQGHKLEITNAKKQLLNENNEIAIKNNSNGKEIIALHDLNERQKKIILAGGLLNHTRKQNN